MTRQEKLSVLTLNTRGLRDTDKRIQTFTWLQHQKADIILLQETHFTNDMVDILSREWKGKCYHNFGTNLSRGVSILFKHNVHITKQEVYRDDIGRKILVNCEIRGEIFTFVNIYAPNTQTARTSFLKDLINWLHSHDIHNLIIGGD